ncbi:MAG: anaerobic ribonucleoside-triphosphate reductase activating protein [Syntrophaceae bacterium]|nr:anaerobic ribonucleoside-triphosphate reductase activating protein [Syntrophaceae bacterium]
MKIGGLQRVSLIDYPGFICAVVFLQGCNFRCSYCHNPELVEPRLFQPCIKEKHVFEFLSTRKGKLDAVTITGGEPTIQKKLCDFIKQIKKMGYAIKLDTNGSQSHVIKTLLAEELLDFISMDIKAPLERYKEIVKVPVDSESIMESIRLILKSKITYEFRTTIVQSQLDEDDILRIGKLIAGAGHYVLQKFVPIKALEKEFLKEKNYPDDKLQRIKKSLENEIRSVTIR